MAEEDERRILMQSQTGWIKEGFRAVDIRCGCSGYCSDKTVNSLEWRCGMCTGMIYLRLGFIRLYAGMDFCSHFLP